ncbi:hypothetical protein V496_08034, partial [Pseudogymnoascus sp. VKM F-4515 (FW-2607)]
MHAPPPTSPPPPPPPSPPKTCHRASAAAWRTTLTLIRALDGVAGSRYLFALRRGGVV